MRFILGNNDSEKSSGCDVVAKRNCCYDPDIDIGETVGSIHNTTAKLGISNLIFLFLFSKTYWQIYKKSFLST